MTSGDRLDRKQPDAVLAWRAWLTRATSALLAFAFLSGLLVYLLPFSALPQFVLLAHVLFGLLLLPPLVLYAWRHWQQQRSGNLSHYQLLGYTALLLATIGMISGLVLTAQGLWWERIDYLWDFLHLYSGLAVGVVLIVHVLMIWIRPISPKNRDRLAAAKRSFLGATVLVSLALVAGVLVVTALYDRSDARESAMAFPAGYDWRFGEDRPFAPSLSRVDDTLWRDSAIDAVRGLLGEDDQTGFDAALAADTNHRMGLIEQMSVATAGLALSPEQGAGLEAILATATEELHANGAVPPEMLAGSATCGSSGCHQQIYEEWLPSAHRYSSMDDMFQTVQRLMVEETSPEHTRYCAGCHDPISLFSGAKDDDNITLSVEGADEGISCAVCHSMVQADVAGNGDYTLAPAVRYSFEQDESELARTLSDFLIRTYPRQHIESYSRPLYKTAEFCAACHKQYVDLEVNVDIGRVQGQNQYDSWRNSRWFHEDDPAATIQCRECHMPLQASEDPARGDVTDPYRHADDDMHRSHRTLASNQYIPLLQGLEGAEEHVRLTEAWMRGEIEIPEIADRWTDGPVVRMSLGVPESVQPGDEVPVRVFLTNNKTGHDFPTGPLDMIESWVELTVTDAAGREVFHTGGLDEDARVDESPVVFRADGYDREGELIDRHNLWDLVGASYKRVIYPGMSDTVQITFQCPSLARGRVSPRDERTGAPGQRTDVFALAAPAEIVGPLTVSATLWYRKANPDFLDRVYGYEAGVRAPATAVSEATATIAVLEAEPGIDSESDE
jgi:cytochrome c554/c'-like protein